LTRVREELSTDLERLDEARQSAESAERHAKEVRARVQREAKRVADLAAAAGMAAATGDASTGGAPRGGARPAPAPPDPADKRPPAGPGGVRAHDEAPPAPEQPAPASHATDDATATG